MAATGGPRPDPGPAHGLARHLHVHRIEARRDRRAGCLLLARAARGNARAAGRVAHVGGAFPNGRLGGPARGVAIACRAFRRDGHLPATTSRAQRTHTLAHAGRSWRGSREGQAGSGPSSAGTECAGRCRGRQAGQLPRPGAARCRVAGRRCALERPEPRSSSVPTGRCSSHRRGSSATSRTCWHGSRRPARGRTPRHTTTSPLGTCVATIAETCGSTTGRTGGLRPSVVTGSTSSPRPLPRRAVFCPRACQPRQSRTGEPWCWPGTAHPPRTRSSNARILSALDQAWAERDEIGCP